MKYKVQVVLIIGVIGIAAFFGLIKRQSYTNVVSEENFMDQMLVAELSEELARSNCEEMEQMLLEAPIVLRVSPMNEMEYFFASGRQKVTVQKVYKGDGIEKGQDIFLTFSRWSVVLTEVYDTVQCGFVNVMKKNKEYLVFLSDQYEGADGEKVYPFFGETYVAPMFCYEDMDNLVIPVEGSPTYVPYSLVKDNEFFVTSENALRVMLDLKKGMLERYTKAE